MNARDVITRTELVQTSPGLPGADPDVKPRLELRLHAAVSDGPAESRDWKTGAPYDDGTDCPGCETIPGRGAPILKLNGAWWHAGCAQTFLRLGGADAAWCALAADLVRRPSHYRVPEIRAITGALLRMVGGAHNLTTLPPCDPPSANERVACTCHATDPFLHLPACFNNLLHWGGSTWYAGARYTASDGASWWLTSVTASGQPLFCTEGATQDEFVTLTELTDDGGAPVLAPGPGPEGTDPPF